MKKQKFVLMFDKRGWTHLLQQNLGLDYAYFRERSSLPEVDVPKGSLVIVDADSIVGFSVIATCQDLFEQQEHTFQTVKVTCLWKEIVPIDEATYNVLKTASPCERYKIMTDRNKYPIVGATVGDTVRVSRSNLEDDSIGIIRYIGPLDSISDNSIWYGVEFIDGTQGTCDGTLGQKRYFQSEPFRSRFFSADKLSLYKSKPIVEYSDRSEEDKYDSDDSYKKDESQNNCTPTNSSSQPGVAKGSKSGVYTSNSNNRLYEYIYSQISAKNKKVKDRASIVQQLLKRDSPLSINNNESIAQDATLQLGDRMVWPTEIHGPQFGTVRWIGLGNTGNSTKPEKDVFVGLELDHEVGSGNGVFEGKVCFSARKNFAEFLPLACLMKADDFDTELPNSENLNNNFDVFTDPRREPQFNEIETILPVYKNESRLTFSRHFQRQTQNNSMRKTKACDNENLESSNRDNQNQNTIVMSLSSDSFKNSKPNARNDGTFWKEGNLSYNENILRSSPEDQFVLPEFDRIFTDSSKNKKVESGTLVELFLKNEPRYGVIKWLGNFPPPDHHVEMAGIELEDELEGAGDGWHNGMLYFKCPANKGVFVPFTHFQRDQRFDQSYLPKKFDGSSSLTRPNLQSPTFFGDLDCPVVPGSYPPISMADLSLLMGRNKGIQGHQNSCYLDATLFAMFSFTCVFDCLLFRPPTDSDILEYKEVQRVLREEIVNPLRKNFFVRADRVMKLRQLLSNLTSVKGLTSEEKDPEEFLNSLLSQTLRASPFLELSSGQTSHLYQLFVMRDESRRMPSVQDLFEQSFLDSGVRLSKVPSVLILQMPRFGKQYKVYDRILPSLFLDVTDIIEDSPRQCIICSQLGTYECKECLGDHSKGLDGTVFCESCLEKQHLTPGYKRHKWKKLKFSNDFILHGFQSSSRPASRLFMELFAVVCIETSHYVSFVKSGTGPDASWCFFDSMADRKGEYNGYNIPEVTAASSVSKWLTDDGVLYLNSVKDEKSLPDQAKRLFCDAYMCFYQSTDIMMYQ